MTNSLTFASMNPWLHCYNLSLAEENTKRHVVYMRKELRPDLLTLARIFSEFVNTSHYPCSQEKLAYYLDSGAFEDLICPH